ETLHTHFPSRFAMTLHPRASHICFTCLEHLRHALVVEGAVPAKHARCHEVEHRRSDPTAVPRDRRVHTRRRRPFGLRTVGPPDGADEREFDLHRDLLRRIAAEHLEYGLLVLAVDAVVLSSNERAASAGMEVDAWHTHPDLAKLRVRKVPEHVLRRAGETRGAADLRRRGIHGRRLLAPHRTANRLEIEVRSVD